MSNNAEIAPSSPLLLDIRDASVLRGTAQVLDRLALTVAYGQHTAILGPNGAGKSTLIALITRDLYPLHGGRVRIAGQDRWKIADLRTVIGVISPATQLDLTSDSGGRLTVFDAVASSFFGARGLWRRHSLTEEMRGQANEALERMAVAHLIDRDVATLSSGEARRVVIARALVHRPTALLLDEACQGLDPGTRRRFLDDLRELCRDGTTLILVTHHIEEVLPEVSQVILLKQGRTTAIGSKETLLTGASLSELFESDIEVSRSGAWYWTRHAETDPSDMLSR